jgi:hypothetical protein
MATRQKTWHWMVGRETVACGVVRTVFFARTLAEVTCRGCRREMRVEHASDSRYGCGPCAVCGCRCQHDDQTTAAHMAAAGSK